MSLISSIQPNTPDVCVNFIPKTRQASYGDNPNVLTDIYQEENNIVIWKRDLSEEIKVTTSDFLTSNPNFKVSMLVSPEKVRTSLNEFLPGDAQQALRENIAELHEMFCYLFDLDRAGLRLTVLEKAMCPKFHVDRVPCRLVTTFQGVATEWLEHEVINREKLGRGSQGKNDAESGLYLNEQDIQQLKCGDVALLKGELWEGNENAGLVHRSPALRSEERRLLLTLDFAD